jgi:universal stress protein A
MNSMNAPSETAPNTVRKTEIEVEQITPAKCPGQIYRRILAATDFSAQSTAAFEQGLKIAKQNNAELLIAHFTEEPCYLSFAPPDSYAEWKNKCRTEAEKNIGALIEKAHKENVKAHMLALEGIADNAIVETAKQLGVDLIVIGTHGHPKVSRFVLGSVVAHTIARAPCAVLTVHSSARAS